MRATVFAAFAVVWLLARLAAAQVPVILDARPVDRAHLVIEGAKAFTAEQISQALWTDLDVAYASNMPSSPGEQQRLLVEKTIAGYRHAGFPHVRLWLDLDGDQTVLTVDEGPRFTAGAVRVEGAEAIDAVRLVEGLKPRPPDAAGEVLRWPTGEPAWFDQLSEMYLAERIAALAAEQGYYRPDFFLRTECDDTNETARLVIDFVGEGQRATVAEVLVTGNQKNSREQILEFLAVHEEMALTAELRAQIANKLVASGRFVRCEWMLGTLAQRGDDWQPRLVVNEYAEAPGLAEPLSREEAALLKFSQWVSEFESSDDEFAISFRGSGEWVDVVVAPREGFIALTGKRADDEPPKPFQAALVMSEQQVGLYSVSQRRKIVAVPPPAHMTANASVTIVDGAPQWDGRSKLMMGVGMHVNARRHGRRHLKLLLSQAASAALSVIRKHQANCSWDAGVLTARWNDRTLRIEAASGRLVDQIVVDKKGGETPAGAKAPATEVRTRAVRGEYARRLAEIEAAVADFENRLDVQRPASCVAEFVCDELKAEGRLEEYPACQRAAPLFSKLASRGLFKPLDDLLLAIGPPSTGRFWIPVPPGMLTRFNDWGYATRWLATYFGLSSGDSLFGDTSWLADVWRRQVLLRARGQLVIPGSFGDGPIDGPFSQWPAHRGPLWALAAAQLLHWQHLDPPAATYAQQGLARLSSRDFRRDYQDVVFGHSLFSECLLNSLDILRGLNREETKTLTDALVELEWTSADMAQRCNSFLDLLRPADQQPIGEAIARAFDQCWRAGLSGWVDERLQHLAGPVDTYPAFVGPAQPEGAIAGPPVVGQSARYGTATYGSAHRGAKYGGPVFTAQDPPMPVATAATENKDSAGEKVATEIARLQALVRSLAYRVAELESRSPPPDDDAEEEILEAHASRSSRAE